MKLENDLIVRAQPRTNQGDIMPRYELKTIKAGIIVAVNGEEEWRFW